VSTFFFSAGSSGIESWCHTSSYIADEAVDVDIGQGLYKSARLPKRFNIYTSYFNENMNLISYDRHLIIVKGKAAWMQASSELEGMVWASVGLALLGVMLVADCSEPLTPTWP
jgi:hypothetical protein